MTEPQKLATQKRCILFSG